METKIIGEPADGGRDDSARVSDYLRRMDEGHEALLDTARRLSERLSPADLDGTLQQITAAAVEVLPEVQFASITIRHADGRLETSAPTDTFLFDLDKRQYELQEGPCYQAASEAAQLIAPNLAADERYPNYGPVAVGAGIRAQAGIRLFEGAKSTGALNLYSKNVGAFEDVESLGALFAHQAAVAIAYASEIRGLTEAVRTRTLIGQAVGIVMERYRLSDDRAFAFLTRLSQARNVKLRLVAQEMVEAGADSGAERSQASAL